MEKKLLASWGNNISKEISFTDKISQGIINVGNQNSYGDCFIPKSLYAIKSEKLDTKKDFFSSSKTINDLLTVNKIGLYGIPGKSNVTLGGAVASDTHGKDNIWGGSFERNIKEIYIQLPNGEKLVASRDKEVEIFESTIGGYGLTGSILGCSFNDQLPSYSDFYSKSIKTGSGIGNLLSSIAFENKVYTVCWVDLLSRKNYWVIENYKEYENFKLSKSRDKNNELNISIPFIGKNFLGSMSFINKAYYFKNKLFQNNIVDIQKALYPLGLLTDTRNVSKNRKIIQVQFSIPNNEESNLEELINLLIYNQFPILCSIKKLNNSKNYNNLSFHQNGWAVAVDFPYENFDNKSIRHFYRKLIERAGKIYLAKDSTLNVDEFREMYPKYKEWEKILKKLDPKNIYQSELSNRLGLKTW